MILNSDIEQFLWLLCVAPSCSNQLQETRNSLGLKVPEKNTHKKGAIYQNPKQITSKSHDKWHHIPIAFHESHFLG